MSLDACVSCRGHITLPLFSVCHSHVLFLSVNFFKIHHGFILHKLFLFRKFVTLVSFFFSYQLLLLISFLWTQSVYNCSCGFIKGYVTMTGILRPSIYIPQSLVNFEPVDSIYLIFFPSFSFRGRRKQINDYEKKENLIT